MFWFILYRNGGREISDMVVAWLDEQTSEAEIDKYLEWDRKASDTTAWELVRVPRIERESYFKPQQKKSDPDDLLEYHWVLEDLRNANEEILRSIH